VRLAAGSDWLPVYRISTARPRGPRRISKTTRASSGPSATCGATDARKWPCACSSRRSDVRRRAPHPRWAFRHPIPPVPWRAGACPGPRPPTRCGPAPRAVRSARHRHRLRRRPARRARRQPPGNPPPPTSRAARAAALSPLKKSKRSPGARPSRDCKRTVSSGGRPSIRSWRTRSSAACGAVASFRRDHRLKSRRWLSSNVWLSSSSPISRRRTP